MDETKEKIKAGQREGRKKVKGGWGSKKIRETCMERKQES